MITKEEFKKNLKSQVGMGAAGFGPNGLILKEVKKPKERKINCLSKSKHNVLISKGLDLLYHCRKIMENASPTDSFNHFMYESKNRYNSGSVLEFILMGDLSFGDFPITSMKLIYSEEADGDYELCFDANRSGYRAEIICVLHEIYIQNEFDARNKREYFKKLTQNFGNVS